MPGIRQGRSKCLTRNFVNCVGHDAECSLAGSSDSHDTAVALPPKLVGLEKDGGSYTRARASRDIDGKGYVQG